MLLDRLQPDARAIIVLGWCRGDLRLAVMRRQQLLLERGGRLAIILVNHLQ